jgi:uncharacterized metal-binding protein YceD (DUF177 family)
MHKPALSRPVRVSDVPKAGLNVEVVAGKEERAALAADYGLESIERLEAQLVLHPAEEGLTVSGRLEAQVTYRCVVTLEPVHGHVIEEIRARFAHEGFRGHDTAAEIEVTLNDDDPPEPILRGMADVGPLVAEFLALGLDPYPRSPGADFAEPAPPARPDNPFGVLAKIGKGRADH